MTGISGVLLFQEIMTDTGLVFDEELGVRFIRAERWIEMPSGHAWSMTGAATSCMILDWR